MLQGPHEVNNLGRWSLPDCSARVVLTMNEVKWSTALRDMGKQTVMCMSPWIRGKVMCTGEGCASSLQACVQGRLLSAQVSRIADIIVDADSLSMRFPKLASTNTEGRQSAPHIPEPGCRAEILCSHSSW